MNSLRKQIVGEIKVESKAKSLFFKGMTAGVPVAVGYITIAVTFGLLAKSFDVPTYAVILMSLVVYAGASQFIGVNLLMIGASFGEIVMTTFILNLRHFLMTATVSQKLKQQTSKSWRALLAFGVTDETFTVSMVQPDEKLDKYFLLGLNITAFAAWNTGTWLGLFFASELPAILKSSMGIALYSMFIGLLIPHIKRSRPVFVVALLAIAINLAIHALSKQWGFSAGSGVIVATVVSAAAGAWFFDAEVKE